MKSFLTKMDMENTIAALAPNMSDSLNWVRRNMHGEAGTELSIVRRIVDCQKALGKDVRYNYMMKEMEMRFPLYVCMRWA